MELKKLTKYVDVSLLEKAIEMSIFVSLTNELDLKNAKSKYIGRNFVEQYLKEKMIPLETIKSPIYCNVSSDLNEFYELTKKKYLLFVKLKNLQLYQNAYNLKIFSFQLVNLKTFSIFLYNNISIILLINDVSKIYD